MFSLGVVGGSAVIGRAISSTECCNGEALLCAGFDKQLLEAGVEILASQRLVFVAITHLVVVVVGLSAF